MKSLLLAGVCAIALSGAAYAQTEVTTTTTTTKAPVQTNVVKKTYTYSYDKNHNGIIEPGEFTTYIYDRSDYDRSGYLADDEWNVTTTRWYRTFPTIDTKGYAFWDQDKDSRLDSNEVETLVTKTDLYNKWDTNVDTKVDVDEFSAGTFRAYDDNGDGMISQDEWKDVLM